VKNVTKLIRVSALASVLALVVAIPAMGVSSHEVPIKGSTLSVDDSVDPAGCPEGTSWKYLSSGEGQVSHLGRVHIEVAHCTVLDWETGTGTFGHGGWTLTAANGDHLHFSHQGSFEFLGDVALITGTWTVTGGDGRFTGASGHGEIRAVSDFLTGTTAMDMAGVIVYEASARSR
jgi:hypothetical protein